MDLTYSVGFHSSLIQLFVNPLTHYAVSNLFVINLYMYPLTL